MVLASQACAEEVDSDVVAIKGMEVRDQGERREEREGRFLLRNCLT